MGNLKACIALFCLLLLQIEAIETGEGNRTCPNDSLPCDDGECVSRGKWCDDDKNCKDESDEAYCAKKRWYTTDDPNSCGGTHFLCNIGHCIPFVGKCDGFEDCKDKSDEWNCKTETGGPEADDDYEDYLLSTTTSVAPLPSSSRNFYEERIEQESIHTDAPSSTTLSTSAPKLTVEVPTSSQVTIKNTTATKPFLPATHQTTPHPQTWKAASNPVLTSMKSDQNSTQSRSQLEERSPSFQTQTSSIVPHDKVKESQHPLTQTSILSSYGAPNKNQPISSSPKPITDVYQHQTQPIRPQESSRLISENQQRGNRQRSSSTLQQPYNARQPTESRPQTYEDRRNPVTYTQQPYNTRPPYESRPQTYESRRNPDPYPQQSYNTRPPYESRPQTYESRRNPDHYTSQVSSPRSYVGQPTGQVERYHVTLTGETINGFQIYRIFSSDRRLFYDGYYNHNGQFVTLNSNAGGQERYPPLRTTPPIRHRPRPLTISTAAPLPFNREKKAPSRFYFAKDYARTYLRENAEYIERGRDWILSNRSSEGGWGLETPRALIALSLINNSFVNETHENNIMQKHFQVFLGTSLIRGDTKTTSINRLAMSVNALIATCQNPRDFHGTDYTELIREKLREQFRNSQPSRNGAPSPNPFVCLSLCLADRDLEREEVHHLMTRLQSHDSQDEFELDKNTIAISALACHLQRQKAIYPSHYKYLQQFDSVLRDATRNLLNRMRHDGSFGSVYSTAIAAQALMSVNETDNWNPESTFTFLRGHQKDDGSFGDFLATYLVLPALSGRSLLHLRNTQCTPPNSDRVLTPAEILAFKGPKHYVKYSIFIGNPKTNGYSIEVHVPVDINFFDIMRVAAHKKDAFKFSYEETDGGIHVYSISNVPNDSERDLEWNLFVTSRSNTQLDKPESLTHIRTGMDIKKFRPRADEHVIFWYKPSNKWT